MEPAFDRCGRERIRSARCTDRPVSSRSRVIPWGGENLVLHKLRVHPAESVRHWDSARERPASLCKATARRLWPRIVPQTGFFELISQRASGAFLICNALSGLQAIVLGHENCTMAIGIGF